MRKGLQFFVATKKNNNSIHYITEWQLFEEYPTLMSCAGSIDVLRGIIDLYCFRIYSEMKILTLNWLAVVKFMLLMCTLAKLNV